MRASSWLAVALVLSAAMCRAQVKYEDNQLHVFPGGLSGPGIGSNVQQAPGVDPTGTTDSTLALQTLIDSGVSPLVWPAGTYVACGLVPRTSQIWVGAGKAQTILQIPVGCAAGAIISLSATGPGIYWDVSGITFRSNSGPPAQLISMDGGTALRAKIHDCAFDLGFGQTAAGNAGVGGTAGISWSGGADLKIADNEFYSTVPGYGTAIALFRAARDTQVVHNTWRWTYNGATFATLNGTESALIEGNTGDLGWYAEPVKFTGSGGTVTYGANTLTDTAANFTGLCNDTGTPGACAGITGNWVRVMTPIVTGTASVSFFAPGVIQDAGVNFTTAGVARGNLVRTAKVCRGNGSGGPTLRQVCTGSAGTSAFGDGCACAGVSDCASAVCEARFATIMGTIDATHVPIDEWVSDVDRRPVGQPNAGVGYTIYSWVRGQVASYTSTVITVGVNTTGWNDWFGNLSTPANGTLYEVESHHPNYQIIASSSGGVVTKTRVALNTLTRGYSDQIGIQFGTNFLLEGNEIADGQDAGMTVNAAQSQITGNQIDHQGSAGMFLAADVKADSNVIQNPTWTNTANTTYLGCINAGGSRVALSNNKCIVTLAMALNRYGLTTNGTVDSATFANNIFQGTFTAGQYRLNGVGTTNAHIVGYHGETISTAGGPTFSIEGGLSTCAALIANAAQNGSYCGTSDCTVANPCAVSGTGAVAKRQGGAWVCN